ncbi:MAG: acyl carrier protein [Planctomycetia bacterium]|nr:acyl carrier protein [Planctomycetia bacterium]
MLQQRLLEVFRRVFNRPSLEISDEMDADDIDGWDSLAHIGLIVAIEKEFQVHFKNHEIARLNCIGDLKALLLRYQPELA